MDARHDFCTGRPYVDLYETMEDKGHSQHFTQRISFWTSWSSVL